MKRRGPGRARATRVRLALIVVGLVAGPVVAEEDSWTWDLPRGFPTPSVPEDNPMSRPKVDLGRDLFFDPRLSVTGAYACSSCHDPEKAFTDGRARALGATGESHSRSTMSLVNVAYNASFGWANPETRELEDQSKIPLLGTHPIELGLGGRAHEATEALQADPVRAKALERAFPEAGGRFTLLHVRRALAAYQRTLISASSPYDRYVFYDDRDAMSAAALRGMGIFFSESAGCDDCHPAPLFTSPARYAERRPAPSFHNTGLYNFDGVGAYPEEETGLFEHSGLPGDMGRFRVPTLRNVALTAPYMHDGSIATLGEVVLHYASGGRNHNAAGARGPRSPLQSPTLESFALSPEEADDLVAFLESLSDVHSGNGRPRSGVPASPLPGR